MLNRWTRLAQYILKKADEEGHYGYDWSKIGTGLIAAKTKTKKVSILKKRMNLPPRLKIKSSFSNDEKVYEGGNETRLAQEVNHLHNQLENNQKMQLELQNEMETRISKYNDEVERGKQRENKLMFFLYVLKEEKKCPVTEVFDDYIKPLSTRRFTTDYGDDYRKVLKKIKKEKKYEKLYNRALKKMR